METLFPFVQLVITLHTRQLCVEDIKTLSVYECLPVAIGKPSTPTPLGHFYVESVVLQPEFVSFKTGRNLGKGILGDVAITLGTNPNLPSSLLAIHGTNQPQLIGSAVSHGCIRMTNKDIRHLTFSYYFNSVLIK